MSLTETDAGLEYDDRLVRRNLARAVSAHEGKMAELVQMQTAVKDAEAKLLALKDQIDATADTEERLDEAVASSLQAGKNISEHNPALQSKRRRDALIEEHALLTRGWMRLKAKADGLERACEAELAELHRVREPILQHMLETLATELAQHENIAAELRSKLYGYSMCGNGSIHQKMPVNALALLRSQPKNAAQPMLNSPEYFAVQRQKECFRQWKRALEVDPSARLEL